MSGGEENKDFLEGFDLEKFLQVFKSLRFLFLGIVFLTTFLAFLYVRYTKPVYESKAIIKLNFESEAKVLNFSGGDDQDIDEISGEIELIKSKLFLKRVIDKANIDVSYHVAGRYLTNERFRNNPFEVSYGIINPAFYNKRFNIKFKENNQFTLSYEDGGETITSKVYSFAQEIKTKDFNLVINKKDKEVLLDENTDYFFIIHNEDNLTGYLQGNLTILPENYRAKTIQISFKEFNIEKAQYLVNLICKLYLNYTKEVKNVALDQKIDFLKERIATTEKELSSYENYFEKFTIEHRTVNLSQDLSRTIVNLEKYDSQKVKLRDRLLDLKLLQTKVKNKSDFIVNPMLAEQFPSSLVESLNKYSELISERELKLNSYNESSFIIQQMDLKIDKLQSEVESLISAYKSSLQERYSSIKKGQKKSEKNLSKYPSMDTQYEKNKRLYELKESFILQLQEAMMQLEITKAGTVSKSLILSSASKNYVPIQPNKKLLLAAGFVFGLIISILLLLIKYLLNNTISSQRELKSLTKIPIIGTIPLYTKIPLKNAKLVIDKTTQSSISEALRALRTNMSFFKGIDKKQSDTNIISVTSTVSGEGKTFVASNLGATMALGGKKVIIVDLDMRKPKVNLVFDTPISENGMSTILVNQASVKESIRNTPIKNFDYITAGPIPPNPSELLMQGNLDKILIELKNNYDVIILDTPPVGVVTDGLLVMRKSDIQLYVVRSSYSKRNYIKELNELKKSSNFPSLSLIFNGEESKNKSYGYGYGYYKD